MKHLQLSTFNLHVMSLFFSLVVTHDYTKWWGDDFARVFERSGFETGPYSFLVFSILECVMFYIAFYVLFSFVGEIGENSFHSILVKHLEWVSGCWWGMGGYFLLKHTFIWEGEIGGLLENASMSIVIGTLVFFSICLVIVLFKLGESVARLLLDAWEEVSFYIKKRPSKQKKEEKGITNESNTPFLIIPSEGNELEKDIERLNAHVGQLHTNSASFGIEERHLLDTHLKRIQTCLVLLPSLHDEDIKKQSMEDVLDMIKNTEHLCTDLLRTSDLLIQKEIEKQKSLLSIKEHTKKFPPPLCME